MKRPQPTFIELLSSFSVPIVIVPAEAEGRRRDAVAHHRHRALATGGVPARLATCKLKRFDGYTPNTNYDDRTGFGGYKQACFDTATFRIVTEPGARVAGLQTGELQGVEDVPTKSVEALKNDTNVTLVPLPNWWVQISIPSTSAPPTDNLNVRQAIQAALDMDEIMDAATDGNYRLNVGFPYPNQPNYTDAGKETYNIKNPAKAKQYLAEAGYKGEPVVLLTNKDYTSMYNAAVVMAEQLKAVGIKTELKVVDWPTMVNMQLKNEPGWNLIFTAYGTQPALGPLATMQFFVSPHAVYEPKDDKDDPDLRGGVERHEPVAGRRSDRQAALVRMQTLILERVYALPLGALTKVQAVRANVQGFKSFRIPRMSNVWFTN